MLLGLIHQMGINPKRVSSTKGGEYKSPCPSCGGEDRFTIQPAQDYYICRQCNCSGDSIQFCRDFLNLSFHEALEKIGAQDTRPCSIPKVGSSPITLRQASTCWKEKATVFMEAAHQRLIADSAYLGKIFKERGLKEETIRTHRLGFNPTNRFFNRSEWGLEETQESRKICLPMGLVIPAFDFLVSNEAPIHKIKIRRSDWKEGDKYSKYQEVTGGSNVLPFYGLRMNQTALMLESELDAMVCIQEIGDTCSCIALGGVSKEPDINTAEWLRTRKLILYSLDCDEAGRKRYDFWRAKFPNLRAWPADSNKSPADSFVKDGINLKEWFLAGVSYWLQSMSAAKD